MRDTETQDTQTEDRDRARGQGTAPPSGGALKLPPNKARGHRTAPPGGGALKLPPKAGWTENPLGLEARGPTETQDIRHTDRGQGQSQRTQDSAP